MPRSFRFVPPEPRPTALHRPRLLQLLLGRWENRVTLLVGGPGLGKTTLLAQAMAENRLAPHGEDVWVGVEPHDNDAEPLGLAVTAALASAGDREPVPGNGTHPLDPQAMAEMVWQRSPGQVCLMFDDVHLLQPGSAGTEWLGAFLQVQPANGHVLLACRSEPALGLSRLEGMGAVLRLDEEVLRLTPDELGDFADHRGVDAEQLQPSGGWPAMAELAATSGSRGSTYLWEQVLEPLGSGRRRLLAIVSDLGGADDRLASAALGIPVDLTAALADVPLVAVGADGWHVPHLLWRSAPGMTLPEPERADVRRRAVQDLLGRGRIDQAFTLVREIELWDAAPAVLRAACLESERLSPRQLERCLSASPATVRASPSGRLASALRLAFTRPAAALEPLRTAAQDCRAAGDVEAELTALAQLGRLAWGRQDLASIGGQVALRITEIEATGNPTARGLAAFIRALIADLAGDDSTVLAELDTIEPGVLDPVWETMAVWLRGGVRIDRGEAEAVAEALEEIRMTGDPAIIAIVGGLRARLLWALGRIDQAVEEIPALLVSLREAGIASIHAQGLTNASLALSYAGEVAMAQECLAEATGAATEPIGGLSDRTALARASLLLAQGDDDQAAAVIREAMGDATKVPDQGADRRVWRHVLSLSYILVPDTRRHWDAASLWGHQAISRTVAAAVVAAREHHGDERLWRLDLTDLPRIRAALHVRHAAELAVQLTAVGRSEGASLLDTLGPAGRVAVQQLTTGRPREAKPAKALLAAAPAPPPLTTFVEILGPLAVSHGEASGRNQRPVVDPDLRRSRVRALFAYLLTHRTTHRAAVSAALWPDLDVAAASNNLGVTLNYLLRVLEPWRRPGEPPYLVRLDGTSIHLMVGPALHVDVDDFDRHLADASRAEAAGNPSASLDHILAASDLYRGDLLVDLPDADWLDLERMHYQSRFVNATTRAAQLLVGHGDTPRAERLAQQALAADPWNEDAYTVLATAALTSGNRTTARRTIEQCRAALAELGAAPSEATDQLARRCGLLASASR